MMSESDKRVVQWVCAPECWRTGGPHVDACHPAVTDGDGLPHNPKDLAEIDRLRELVATAPFGAYSHWAATGDAAAARRLDDWHDRATRLGVRFRGDPDCGGT